jgi:hypothetical protein
MPRDIEATQSNDGATIMSQLNGFFLLALFAGATSTTAGADGIITKSLDTTSGPERVVISGKIPPKDPAPIVAPQPRWDPREALTTSFASNSVASSGGAGRGGAKAAISNPAKTEVATPPASNNTDLPTTDPQQDCSNSATGGTATTGNPVVIATGEKIKSEVDFSPAGIGALGLTRTYRSNGDFGMFGQRWRSNYDWRNLGPSGCYKHADYPGKCIPTEVTVTFPDGANYTYKPRNLNDQIWLQ